MTFRRTFSCERGWCGRTRVSLAGLADNVAHACVTERICVMCKDTTRVTVDINSPVKLKQDTREPNACANPTLRWANLRRTHPALADLLRRRERLNPNVNSGRYHSARIRVTTTDQGDKSARYYAGGDGCESDCDAGEGGGGEDDNQVADDATEADVASPALDADGEEGIDDVDDVEGDGGEGDCWTDERDGKRKRRGNDQPCGEYEREANDDHEAMSNNSLMADTDEEDDKEEESAASTFAKRRRESACLLCARGRKRPLCAACTRNIRKRARPCAQSSAACKS